MPADIQGTPQPTTSELLGGIAGDLQRLVTQQLHLTWLEIEEESHLFNAALGLFAFGAAAALLGLLTGCLALVHLLHWWTSPVHSDPASLPLWACHALVAMTFLVIGAGLVQVGRLRLKAMELYRTARSELLPEHVS